MKFLTETERLLLRDAEEGDYTIILEHFIDPSVRDGILSFQPDEEHTQRFIENAILSSELEGRTGYGIAIVLKGENIIIGSGSMSRVYPGSTEMRIGWHLGNEHQGRGYATEAATEMLHFGFEERGVERIYAEAFTDNEPSIRVIKKIGMIPYQSSFFRRWLRGINYGEQRPISRYHIFKEQWFARQGKT